MSGRGLHDLTLTELSVELHLGLCSLAMPAGFSAGLPIDVQIIGKPYAEDTVLRLGKAYQDATDFHRQAPALSALGL